MLPPPTLLSQECLRLILEMRKNLRFLQSGVAAILSLLDTVDLCSDDIIGGFRLSPAPPAQSAVPKSRDPVLSGFLQLRQLLTDGASLDSLTVLQPYLVLVTHPRTSGLVTQVALGSLAKLWAAGLLEGPEAVNRLLGALSRTQFELLDPALDDLVILKVLDLIRTVVVDSHLQVQDDVLCDVVLLILALACNKRRSEVLRRYAETALTQITGCVFSHVLEDPFYAKYLAHLVLFVAAENQYHHTELTKIFVLGLLLTVLETSGTRLPEHPALLSIVQYSLCKHLLTIILNNDGLNLLQAALLCFVCLSLTLKPYLGPQLEFAYENIFKSVLSDPSFWKDTPVKNPKNPKAVDPIHDRNPLAKELIVESMSLLWTQQTDFLLELFVNYDCRFDNKDVSITFVRVLDCLAELKSAEATTNNVPPLCLDGLLAYVNGLGARTKARKRNGLVFDQQAFEKDPMVQIRRKKEEFLAICKELNEPDMAKFKEALIKLEAEGFLAPGEESLGAFFYYKANHLNKRNVGEYITKPKNLPILKAFLSHFKFTGKRVDEALRLLLQRFRIPGESQQIERVVENFASKYVEDQDYEAAEKEYGDRLVAYNTSENKKNLPMPVKPVLPNPDAVFILSYAIIMLNTDLHNPTIKEHMTFEAFKKNLKGVYTDGKDYPEWYLRKIYTLIQDKEIIIPEEHFGTDKWFIGSWEIIEERAKNGPEKGFSFAFGSTDILNPNHVSLLSLSEAELLFIDRLLLEAAFPMLMRSFEHVFEETGDDHRAARLMSAFDKCCTAAASLGSQNLVNLVVETLSRLTQARRTALGESELIRTNIPSTQVVLHNKPLETESDALSSRKTAKTFATGTETVVVSETAVWFGRDFKAQIALIGLCNIVRKTGRNVGSWDAVVEVTNRLFEAGTVSGNLFPDFSKLIGLEPVPGVPPRYVIDGKPRQEEESGLLGAFALYLRIGLDVPPEPTDEEIEATLLAVGCVRTAKLELLFSELLESCAPAVALAFVKDLPKKGKNIGHLTLFALEAATGALVSSGHWDELDTQHAAETVLHALDRTLVANEKASKKPFEPSAVARLLCYEIALVSRIEKRFDDFLGLLKRGLHLLLSSPEAEFAKCAPLVAHELAVVVLGENLWKLEHMTHLEEFWKVLRRAGSLPDHVESVFKVLQTLLKEKSEQIVPESYMSMLGLLDEILLVGAVGSVFEQEQDLNKLGGENPNKHLIELLKSSVDLTGELRILLERADFVEMERKMKTLGWYSLVQAFGHQTLNPCREIRSHALKVFTNTLLSLEVDKLEYVESRGIFEYDVFPLITELMKEEVVYCDYYGMRKTKRDILSSMTRIYLQYLNKQYVSKDEKYDENSELAYIWLTILDSFKNMVVDERKQLEYQARNKKRFPMVTGLKNELILREALREMVKNLLLCMEDCGYLEYNKPEHAYLWEETWKRVKELYPGFVEEFEELRSPKEKIETEDNKKENKENKEKENKKKENKESKAKKEEKKEESEETEENEENEVPENVRKE